MRSMHIFFSHVQHTFPFSLYGPLSIVPLLALPLSRRPGTPGWCPSRSGCTLGCPACGQSWGPPRWLCSRTLSTAAGRAETLAGPSASSAGDKRTSRVSVFRRSKEYQYITAWTVFLSCFDSVCISMLLYSSITVLHEVQALYYVL